jgi:hypothetical protein
MKMKKKLKTSDIGFREFFEEFPQLLEKEKVIKERPKSS